MSEYLSLPADAAPYGLSAQVTRTHVQRASAIIDSYLRRPEGLVWTPDYSGAPGWMAGLKPKFPLTAPGAISPGQNVVVPIVPGFFGVDSVGQTLVLDRANTNLAEVVVISAAQPGQITLASVANAHSAGSLLDVGMVIMEERVMPPERSNTRLSRPNYARLLAGQGRFGYGRRSDQMKGTYNEVNLLATISTFGGPPLWQPWDPNQASVSPTTGDIWVPASILVAYFTEVRLWYVAGFSQANLPDAVKIACATIVENIAGLPAEIVGGQIKKFKAGDTDLDRFTHSTPGRGAGAGNTIIDQNSMALLDPFKTLSYY